MFWRKPTQSLVRKNIKKDSELFEGNETNASERAPEMDVIYIKFTTIFSQFFLPQSVHRPSVNDEQPQQKIRGIGEIRS